MNRKALFIGALVLFVVIGLAQQDKAAQSSGTTTTMAPATATPSAPVPTKSIEWDGRSYTTVEGIPACVDHTRYAEFMGYFRSKENDPLTEMVNNGECVLLKGGQQVIPVEHAGSMWDGQRLVKVRFKGTRQTAVLDARFALAELQ